MLFHLSIDARDPQRVASVLAELFGSGVAMPFPPVGDGSWVAMAGDDRNTLVEVYPRGSLLVEVEGDADPIAVDGGVVRSSTHFAMATALDQGEVMAIARREGWPAKYRKRGGVFGVIEIWIEGDRMIEVLTAEMQQEYLAAMTVSNWRGFLEQGVPA